MAATPLPIPAAPIKNGFLEILKEKISFAVIKEKLNISKEQFVELATYFAIGFFTGFLFKKYARYLIISLILLALALKYMESSGLITLHWDKIQSVVTVNQTGGFEQLYHVAVEWVKAHVSLSISLVVGFIVGYKVG
jgi:uncharacterized membrane protein (Fun14 family)